MAKKKVKKRVGKGRMTDTGENVAIIKMKNN